MFQTIKDAYDKYITMDYRISALEERIKELEEKIRPQKDAFSCRSCETGHYKPNGKKDFSTVLKSAINGNAINAVMLQTNSFLKN